ncbi:helix-turn-helix transcriptional regulator [Streptomyces mutabilis]|uniref:helix-turn-helix domain-containing protein n=1 Tax=Streptomyces mutabilis TaxID=67332 RepID=UPI0022BA19F9|nr:helix-turn-helix transcriptional regulator [Streptomyces mutabilis]MCZ9352956.1 helix-turn-helix transcriptional regulator [Streptomyces mutabilis]
MSSYRLRSARLHEAAAARGDHSNYAIAKRTGLNQTTLSRICRGVAEPATKTLLRLAITYGLSIDELIDRPASVVPGVQSGASSAGNDDGAGVQPAPSVEHSATTAK